MCLDPPADQSEEVGRLRPRRCAVKRLGGVQEQRHRVPCDRRARRSGHAPSETLEDDPCSFRATAAVPKGMKGLPEREVVSGTCPEEVKMKVKKKVNMKIKVKMKVKMSENESENEKKIKNHRNLLEFDQK